MRDISIHVETWQLTRSFTIARGRKNRADVLVVEISENGARGRGEAVPYRRYGETIESATASIEKLIPMLRAGMSREGLLNALLPSAARNALDCALWDLEAKQKQRRVWELAGLPPPKPLTTAMTIVIDTPERMAAMATQLDAFPLLKLKLGGEDGFLADIARLTAIRHAVPDKRLIVDANEGWMPDDLRRYASLLAGFNLELIEQPVPQSQEHALDALPADLCFVADESVHDSESLRQLGKAYRWVNIKLDKTGGLTEALRLAKQARAQNYKLMVGCMVATSLSMAPAHLLGQIVDLIDLDGALWLEQDRKDGLIYENARINPPDSVLWG